MSSWRDSAGDTLGWSLLPSSSTRLLDGSISLGAAYNSVTIPGKLRFSLWPHFYTAACLAVYGIPSISLWHLAQDPSVQFWIGPSGFYAPLIPAFILALHALHLRPDSPRRIPVLFSCVVPAMILIGLAEEHRSVAAGTAHMLLSRDCKTLASKGDVHRSWVVATEVFSGCINRTAAEMHLSPTRARRIRRMQDCREWLPQSPDPWAAHRRAWNYLRDLEQGHSCSGWCAQSAPIWSYEQPRDSCATSAGAVLLTKVKPVMERMLFFSSVAGGVAILNMLTFDSSFKDGL